MIYTIKNDLLTCDVSTLGAEIQSVKCIKTEKEFMWEGREFWQKHAPLLFPICGSITSPYTYHGKEYFMEKHGFISDLDFDAVSVSDSELILSVKENDATLAAYPFAFEFTAKYILDGNRLVSEYTVKNNSGEVMPYMLGLHPAFALHGDAPKEEFCLDFGTPFTVKQYRLSAPFVNQTGFDREFPSGRLYITNEIYEKGTIILGKTKSSIDFLSPAGKVFRMEWSDNFRNLCVWKWTDDKARYVCIEPWTNIPSDGSKTDDLDEKKMQRLKVGGENKYSYAVEFCL